MGVIASVSGAGGNSEIVPVVKWNATKGEFSQVDRAQDLAGNWSGRETVLDLPVQFVIDLENMRLGWGTFVNNRPDYHMVPIADVDADPKAMPKRPSPEHRTNFLVRVYSKTLGLREWRGKQKGVLNAMDDIYTQYKKQRDEHPGQLPVLELYDVLVVTRTGPLSGTDMAPMMRLQEKWRDRPQSLVPFPPIEAPEPQTNGAAEPAQTGSPMRAAVTQAVTSRPPAHVPPPRPTQAQVKAAQAMLAPPPPAQDDDAEFV